LSFIPHQSLRLKHKALALLSIGLIAITACNRQPDACVETSTTSVLVGNSISVNDCSKRGFDNVINMGNGAKFNNESELSYTYYTGGAYRISLTAFSRKGSKKETAETGITVTSPTASQIQGKWTLTKVETREQLEVDQTVSIFDLPIDSARTFSELYDITDDSIFVTHNGEQFYLFQFRNGYKYENGALQINQNNFPIVRFSSTEMVLKGPYFKGFELLYLVR
jgi:PKD repeat protein